jgi:tRNA-specific 2-thiouridylase
MLGQLELERTLLPVGELTKAEVRERAAALGLRTAHKRESMDVCFITKGGRESFLGARITRRPGAVVDVHGVPLGRHDGIDRFTIGQRRGVAVATGERRYVTDIAPATGTVTIGTRTDLLRDSVDLTATTWAAGRPPAGAVTAQWRAHGDAVPARVDGARVVFATPQPRVAPGQVVVCYDGDRVLGGGIALS